MPDFLGIDTSNYTTSAAVYSSESGEIFQAKKLLPVRAGELGLRQSDAVFHHTKQLPEIIEQLYFQNTLNKPVAVSASVRPRNIEGSYMPCFLCGEGTARSLAAIEHIPFYTTSHQIGHVLAALYSAQQLELVNKRFIAFHVSGGTTDCLLCEPDNNEIIKISQIGSSLDLKAGQAVDRTGLMLGLDFPCGIELEKLAFKSNCSHKIKPIIKGTDCCLSGLENKCMQMLDKNESREDTAKFCLDFIAATIIAMISAAIDIHGNLPLVFAGGVMSNTIIRKEIISHYADVFFAAPEFSCDNAAGTAIYGYLKYINSGEK